MRHLKWGIILASFVLLFGMISYAEEPTDETYIELVENLIKEDNEISLEDGGLKAATLSFHAEIVSSEMKERRFLLGLYGKDGQTALSFKLVRMKDWERSFNVEFSVPEYNIGEAFFVKLMEDNGTISYNGETDSLALLQTYAYTDESGKAAKQTAFYGEITPKEEKNVKITLNGNDIKDEFFLLGEEIYVSEDFIKECKIDLIKEDDFYILKSQTQNCEMKLKKGESRALTGSEEISLNYPLMILEDKAYFPLYEVGIYFACYYLDNSTEEEKNISVEYSHYANVSERERMINSLDIESSTDYLIWITKDDYTVNVFTGEKGFWHHYASYPCALGAKSSPTIEGEFEYEEFIERWNYATYYCGPVIRFYRGYALHSTLIRYNGSMYDDRVGVEISHGCIRLHPEDINHLADIIPLGTKIYITK